MQNKLEQFGKQKEEMTQEAAEANNNHEAQTEKIHSEYVNKIRVVEAELEANRANMQRMQGEFHKEIDEISHDSQRFREVLREAEKE